MAFQRSTRWLLGPTILLILVAVFSSGRVLLRGAETTAVDFHSCWYAAHFLWQGTDPYRAILERREPELPISYLDGSNLTIGRAAQVGIVLPGNAPLFLLVIAPLSRISWPVASKIWTLLNLALAFLCT